MLCQTGRDENMAVVSEEKKPKLSYTKRVGLIFLLIAILTVIDGTASWFSIAYMGVAREGNDGLNALANILGFGGAMVVRIAWGIGMAGLLAFLALRFKKKEHRRFAYGGLWFVVVVFLLLLAYHVVVLSVGFLAILYPTF